MAKNETEKNIKQILESGNLSTFAEEYPIFFATHMHVVVIDGESYSEKAVLKALEAIDDEDLKTLLGMEATLFSHNNINGHGGAGGFIPMTNIVFYSSSSELIERASKLKSDLN